MKNRGTHDWQSVRFQQEVLLLFPLGSHKRCYETFIRRQEQCIPRWCFERAVVQGDGRESAGVFADADCFPETFSGGFRT
jgi:hypothetical protein